MRSARITVPLLGCWLLSQGVSPVAGQGLNNAIRPVVESNASVFTPPAGLARTYQVELTSTWNRPDIVRLCEAVGGETISGQLTWTGAAWVGVLRRETTLMECGVHAAEPAAPSRRKNRRVRNRCSRRNCSMAFIRRSPRIIIDLL